MVKIGDLVFSDGWYGIVSDLELRTIFFGNGCDTVVKEPEFGALQPLGRSNFHELVSFFKLRYDPTVRIIRKIEPEAADEKE